MRRLRGLVGLVILVAVLWWFPTEAFTSAFAVLDLPSTAAALVIGVITTLCSAGRWLLVARRVGLRLSLGRAVADYYRALLLNAVLPAGVLGDVHRAVSHGHRSGDLGRGVRAVVLERVAGQAVLVLATAALLFTLPTALLGTGLRAIAISVGVVISALVVGTVGLRFGRARRPRWWRALHTVAQDVRVGLITCGPQVVVLSVVALAGNVCLFVLAASTAGVDAPMFPLVPLAMVALLAMSLPINVGGWGPREAVTAMAFGAVGLGSAQGLTVSVVHGLLALVAALPGAAVLVADPLRRAVRPTLERVLRKYPVTEKERSIRAGRPVRHVRSHRPHPIR